MGYRHYERLAIKPLFAFGHGLSYTTFTYGDITLSNTTLSANDKLTVTIPITNSGKVDGAEVVQGYVHDVKSRLVRPEKELAVFDKVFLKAGETKNVVLTLDKLSVGYYDIRLKAWIAEEGEFKILVGSSSADIRYAYPPHSRISIELVLIFHTDKRLRSTWLNRLLGFSKGTTFHIDFFF